MHRIAELEALLEDERELLRRGAIESLARLAQRKAGLLAGLSAQAPDAAAYTRIRRALERNGRMLAAAGEGLRDAAARLRQLREGEALVTYDDCGRKRTLAGAGPTVSRNA